MRTRLSMPRSAIAAVDAYISDLPIFCIHIIMQYLMQNLEKTEKVVKYLIKIVYPMRGSCKKVKTGYLGI